MGYVLPAVKEKANAKGNGDWHLRESRVCKNSYDEIFIFRHLLRRFLVPCRIFCSCMWREDSKHSVGVSFSRGAGNTATSCTWGFYCGPFCKTVRFSLLDKAAAIQKERKDRGSVLSGSCCSMFCHEKAVCIGVSAVRQ